MLQPFLGDDYTISTAPGGEQGLKLLKEQPYDIVVSDLTMPNMNGIEFLTQVSDRCPATARIVVSGFADEITAAKCLMIGHRYFSKPFNPHLLTTTLLSVCEAQELAASKKVRDCVGQLEGIPTLSRTFQKLTEALNTSDVSILELSAIIEQDPALAAKVLQIVNSARFARAREVNTIFEAVQLLGFNLLQALVIGVQMFQACNKISKTELFETVWAHSFQTAVCAKKLAEFENLDTDKCEEAFLIGLLHDIGKVVLGATCPDYEPIWKECGKNSQLLTTREREVIGATHATAGAYLLRLWGLPEPICSAIEAHHRLDTAAVAGFNPLLAVHVAQELAGNRTHPALNQAALVHAGVRAKVSTWTKVIRAEEATQG
jgi:putative nucleotidyltransferase with HDIG domain